MRWVRWEMRSACEILDRKPKGKPLGKPSIDGRIVMKLISVK
jgi:hypothetical protein